MRILLLLLIAFQVVLPQVLTKSQFLDIAQESLNPAYINTIEKYVPEDFNITALEIGDYTGDGKNDIAFGIRHKRDKGRNIFIFMMVDKGDKYETVYSDSLTFVVIPIEIGFAIKDTTCFLTQKIKDKHWRIRGFSFINEEFAEVDDYISSVNKYENREYGLEQYTNYKNNLCFEGYYRTQDLVTYKKDEFFILPVYPEFNNIYPGYSDAVVIDSKWKWEESMDGEDIVNYGKLYFRYDETYLTAIMIINKSLIKSDSVFFNKIALSIDKNGERIYGKTRKRELSFRDEIDEDVVRFEGLFNQIGYKSENIGSGGFQVECEDGGEEVLFRFRFPKKDIGRGSKAVGAYISIEVKDLDNRTIVLRNCSGKVTSPSTYGKMIFYGENEYFRPLQTQRLDKLKEKIINVLNVPGK